MQKKKSNNVVQQALLSTLRSQQSGIHTAIAHCNHVTTVTIWFPLFMQV